MSSDDFFKEIHIPPVDTCPDPKFDGPQLCETRESFPLPEVKRELDPEPHTEVDIWEPPEPEPDPVPEPCAEPEADPDPAPEPDPELVPALLEPADPLTPTVDDGCAPGLSLAFAVTAPAVRPDVAALTGV